MPPSPAQQTTLVSSPFSRATFANPDPTAAAEAKEEAKEKADQPLGVDPETGLAVRLLVGRYGPFVQLGEQEEDGPKPKRASLPKGVGPEDVDLDVALGLLSLPRLLGEHPERCEKKEREGNGGEPKGVSRHIHTVPVSVPIGKIRRFSSAEGAIDM